MQKWLLTGISCFLLGASSSAQEHRAGFIAAYGLSYFFNEPELPRQIDHSWLIGHSYLYRPNRSAISINPTISFRVNDYHAKVKEHKQVHLTQHIIHLTLDVLLRIHKRAELRAGLFFNKLLLSDISITEKNGGQGYYGYSHSGLVYGYEAQNWQAGVTFGICLPFKLFHRDQYFNIYINQHATSLVRTDFSLSKRLIGDDVKVMTTKAKPTMLMIGLDLQLYNSKRAKKMQEE